MSNFNGRVFLASFAALAAVGTAWFGGYYTAALNYPEEQRYQPYRYSTDKPAVVDLPAPSAPEAKPFEYRRPCDEPEGRDESDLCAQWKAARAAERGALWAERGFWITLFAGIGLFITIMQGRFALARARKANRIASKTAKRQLRAYMGINKYDLTPYEIAVEGSGKFMIGLQNFGQTPAIGLTTQVSYAITTWVDMNTRPETWDFEGGKLPIDVAPGAPMFREIDFSEHAFAHLIELGFGTSAIWVKIHAAYEDVFGRRHEQTTLFYSRRSAYLSGTMLPCEQSRETTTNPERQSSADA